jgi:hypothetical protein
VYDLGHANATGRIYYHNAHIGTCKGGETSWEKPFGYGGSSKLCGGCFHQSHPNNKYKTISVDHVESTQSQFLSKMKLKDHLWKTNGKEEQHDDTNTTKRGPTKQLRKRPIHRYKPLTRLCDECGDINEMPAIWSCDECGYFCTSCLNQTHSTGNRQYHIVEQYCDLRVGNQWNKDKQEISDREKLLEEDRLRRIKEVMYKLDLLKYTRIIQKRFRRNKRLKSQEEARKRKLLQYRLKYKQLRIDNIERLTPYYRIKRGVGLEPTLKSDTQEEIARKHMQPLMTNGLTNKMTSSIGYVKRNILRSEFKLNGFVKMKKGYRIAFTTVDFTDVLQRGDTIRIGPTELYTIQMELSDTEINEKIKKELWKRKKKESKKKKEEEKKKPNSIEDQLRNEMHHKFKVRPFNKFCIPLNKYWYDNDATMNIYYVNNIKELAQCPPETAKDVIDGRRKRAWILKNPKKPNLDAIAAREERLLEDEQRAQFGGETDKEKDERIQKEKAATKARMNTLQNRAKLKAGGRKGRAQRMKAMKRKKAAAAKLAAEEKAREDAWNNSYEDDPNNDD